MLKRILSVRNPPVGAPEAAPSEGSAGLRRPPTQVNVNPVATAQPAAPPPIPAPPPPPTAAAPAPAPAAGAPNTNPVPAAGSPGLAAVPGQVLTEQAPGANTGGYVPDPHAFDGERMGAAVEKFGTDAMNNPTRFDAGVVKQGLDQINQDAARATTERMRSLSELMAKRHIVGSSIEGDSARSLLGDIENTRSQRALDLGLEQARTYASDRTAAGQLGMGAADLSRSLAGDRESANRYGYEAGRTAGSTAEDTRRYNQQYGMQERQQTEAERNDELAALLRAYGLLGAAA